MNRHESFSSSMDGRNQASVTEALNKALQVVGRLSHVVFEQSSSFDQLSSILLEVAQALADLNKNRLGPEPGAAEVLKLSLEEQRNSSLESVVKFGMIVADHMLDCIDDLRKREEGYDIFVSFPGEERFLYQPYMKSAFRTKTPHLRVFFDSSEMGAGKTADSRSKMLEACLMADAVLCITTFHYVQKKWPMAELLCGLARNARAYKRRVRSPLLLDAMPGTLWMLRHAEAQARSPTSWIEDFKALVPLSPQPVIMSFIHENGLEHIDYLIHQLWQAKSSRRLTNEASESSFKPIQTHEEGDYSGTPEANAFDEVFAVLSLSRHDMEYLLEGEPPCTFSIRSSQRSSLKFNDKPILRTAVCTVVVENNSLTQYHFIYDVSNGQFARVYTALDDPNKVDKLRHFKSMSDLLLNIGGLRFKSHDSHVRDMCDFMVRAATKAEQMYDSIGPEAALVTPNCDPTRRTPLF